MTFPGEPGLASSFSFLPQFVMKENLLGISGPGFFTSQMPFVSKH